MFFFYLFLLNIYISEEDLNLFVIIRSKVHDILKCFIKISFYLLVLLTTLDDQIVDPIF